MHISTRSRTLAAIASTVLFVGGFTAAHRAAASGPASASLGSVYVPVVPCRLLDTRTKDKDPGGQIGEWLAPLHTQQTITLMIRGRHGNCDIPASAIGIATNMTADFPTGRSYLTTWPADAPRPTASSLNWTASSPATPNHVDVMLSAAGGISLFDNFGDVDLLIDVVGYYEPLTAGGVPGPPGPAGANGAPGADGAAGPKGDPGPAGPAGVDGSRGPAGEDGAPGADGAPGPKGDDGAPGADGAAGPKGDPGPAGPAGADGAVGPTGDPGPAGPAGADGSRGPAGADGSRGPAGADGAPGPKGDPGPAGTAGDAGPQGPAGADGAPGVDGADGDSAYELAVQQCLASPDGIADPSICQFTVDDYLASLHGDNGDRGPTGPAGADGAPGPQGAQGPQGPPGPVGPGGIASTLVFSGFVGTVPPTNPGRFVFVGTQSGPTGTAQVTTTATQRLTGMAEAPIGLAAGSAPQAVDIALCYKDVNDNSLVALHEFMGDYSVHKVTAGRQSYTAVGSVVPGAGTWEVGMCVRFSAAPGVVSLTDTDFVNGWIQVTT